MGYSKFIRWLGVVFISFVSLTSWVLGNEKNSLPPVGLPPVPIPIDNPQTQDKISLGKRLFHDPQLSANGHISCATCHIAKYFLSDGKRVAEGLKGQRGFRNTPTLLNVAYLSSQFWDGRRISLEQQVLGPLLNPIEHGLTSNDEIINIIRRDVSYIREFKKAFKITSAEISVGHITRAIASFERTLIAGDSPFDRYMYAGDKNALSESASRGLVLFRTRAKCTACHLIEQNYALFSDNQFHRLGIEFKRIESKLATLTTHLSGLGISVREELLMHDPDIAELGRFVITLNPADIGAFKTPSLRNVAVTAPYMHNGGVNTLEEAVDMEIYYRGVEANRPLILTPQEKSDLVEFLKSLTSPRDKLEAIADPD